MLKVTDIGRIKCSTAGRIF